ncbi:hypothetical protein V8E52_002013 [Russula decolorans]
MTCLATQSLGRLGADATHRHFSIHCIFACPDAPPHAPPSTTPTSWLGHFIAYALHRTRLHASVTFTALYLLQHLRPKGLKARLKACFPAAKGSSGHRLFIPAFLLASKIICDDTYSNKSWCIVGQGMFALREMCSYLKWQLNLDFIGPGPYPPMVLPQPAPAPFSHQIWVPPFLHFASHDPLSKDAPVIPSPSIRNIPLTLSNNLEASHSASTSPTSSVSPQTPPDAHEPSIDPNIPLTLSDTSEASHSASTSPMSSVSPQTPPDAHKPVYKLKNSPSIRTYPHPLRYPRGLPLGLDLSRVIGFAANAARCSRAST